MNSSAEENIPFESQNISEIKKEIKEEPNEDIDIFPFESENFSYIKTEVKNEALIREEMPDDQNPKYHVYTVDANGKLCKYGSTEDLETCATENSSQESQCKEMFPREAKSFQLLKKVVYKDNHFKNFLMLK